MTDSARFRRVTREPPAPGTLVDLQGSLIGFFQWALNKRINQELTGDRDGLFSRAPLPRDARGCGSNSKGLMLIASGSGIGSEILPMVTTGGNSPGQAYIDRQKCRVAFGFANSVSPYFGWPKRSFGLAEHKRRSPDLFRA